MSRSFGLGQASQLLTVSCEKGKIPQEIAWEIIAYGRVLCLLHWHLLVFLMTALPSDAFILFMQDCAAMLECF